MNRKHICPRVFPALMLVALLLLTALAAGIVRADVAGNPAPGNPAEGSTTQEFQDSFGRKPCEACAATIDAAVEDGRILEVTGLFYKLFLILAPNFVPDEFKCLDHKKELVVVVREIRANLDRLEGKTVILNGQFMGWSAEGGEDLGIPITRSDWIFKDRTGSIYVTGGNPPGLRPGYPEYKGTEITLVATVIKNQYGYACLRFVDSTVKDGEGSKAK